MLARPAAARPGGALHRRAGRLPVLLAIVYSFSNVTVGSRLHFVGLANFARRLDSPTFCTALRNTFLFALVSQLVVLVLASILAIALPRDFRGKWLVRLLILFPWVAPISLGSIGWLWIFDPIYSVINWSLRAVGCSARTLAGLARPARSRDGLDHHGAGLAHLAPGHGDLLGGLSSIPQDIHDAAAIDGAGFFRQLFVITLPLVFPIMIVAVLFGLVFTVTDMIVVYVLTRGGPFDTTQVLASLAFFKGIDGGDLSGGAAVALFLFPVLVASPRSSSARLAAEPS